MRKYPDILTSLQHDPRFAAAHGVLTISKAFMDSYERRQENLKNGRKITGDEIFKWLKEHPTR